MKSGLILAAIVVFVLILGVVSIFFYKYSIKNPDYPLPRQIDTAESQTKDWQTYTNTEFNYEVDYPPTWEIDEKGLISGSTLRIHDNSYTKPIA